MILKNKHTVNYGTALIYNCLRGFKCYIPYSHFDSLDGTRLSSPRAIHSQRERKLKAYDFCFFLFEDMVHQNPHLKQNGFFIGHSFKEIKAIKWHIDFKFPSTLQVYLLWELTMKYCYFTSTSSYGGVLHKPCLHNVLQGGAHQIKRPHIPLKQIK